MSNPASLASFPSYDEDIYTTESILNPYQQYVEMRELGPVIHLSKHGILALPRYADVKAALLNDSGFISRQGVAAFQWPEEFLVEGTLTSDGDTHARFRSVVGQPLSPTGLVRMTAEIEKAADEVIERLVNQRHFDGMADLARVLPVSIVTTLVGLPDKGRDRMLDWAAASFELMGANNERAMSAAPLMGEMIAYVRNECSPQSVKPGSLTANIWSAVEAGKITPQQAAIMHIDMTAPALDTTIFATGSLLHHLGRNPDQWALLKADPSLIPAAIDEAIRLDSPVRAFARVAKGDQTVAGITIPSGTRVLMMYGSANRDERRWEDPERYWIQRPHVATHLGFGQGVHTCVGAHLAKLEIRSLLKSIIQRVDKINVGTPTYFVNNALRGLEKLPMEFVAA